MDIYTMLETFKIMDELEPQIMAKRKPIQKIRPSYVVSVHSNNSPHIITAVCKGVDKDEAIDMARKLWKLSPSAYMSRVTDQDLNEVFFHKKTK